MFSALALNGVAQDRIAMHVVISPVTLRKFYRDTLDLATESVCARVAKNLVRIASTGSGNAAVQAAKMIGFLLLGVPCAFAIGLAAGTEATK